MYTILLATYNAEKYLNELLESIEKQTEKDWYLIARDDRSTDSTLDILNSFKDKYPDKVNISVNIRQLGSKDNFAMLFTEAKKKGADYVLPADQDDVWFPDKIEVLSRNMHKLEKHLGEDVPMIVHSDMVVVDKDMKTIADSFFSYAGIDKRAHIYKLPMQNNVTGCASIMNKALVNGIAEYIKQDAVIMHDHFAALYACVFGRIFHTDKATVYYRQHDGNVVGAKNYRNPIYIFNRLTKNSKQYRKDLEATYSQCDEFVKIFGDRVYASYKSGDITNDKDYRYRRGAMNLIKEYAALKYKSKPAKIKFYFTYHAWKKGIGRKIMQILWA